MVSTSYVEHFCADIIVYINIKTVYLILLSRKALFKTNPPPPPKKTKPAFRPTMSPIHEPVPVPQRPTIVVKLLIKQ